MIRTRVLILVAATLCSASSVYAAASAQQHVVTLTSPVSGFVRIVPAVGKQFRLVGTSTPVITFVEVPDLDRDIASAFSRFGLATPPRVFELSHAAIDSIASVATHDASNYNGILFAKQSGADSSLIYMLRIREFEAVQEVAKEDNLRANQVAGYHTDAEFLAKAELEYFRGYGAPATIREAVNAMRRLIWSDVAAHVRLSAPVEVVTTFVLPGQWVEAGTPLLEVRPLR